MPGVYLGSEKPWQAEIMRDQKLKLAEKGSWQRENTVDALKEAAGHSENNHSAHERKTRVNPSNY